MAGSAVPMAIGCSMTWNSPCARPTDGPNLGTPKLLWGEFCGSGGQLLAAALLDASRRTLITAPASSGSQVAMRVEKD